VSWDLLVGNGAVLIEQRKRLEGTEQQEKFWERVVEGTANIVLEARAGTGKSVSCREAIWRALEASPGQQIRYTAFNRSVAEDFRRKAPPGAEVGTFHSFCWQSLGDSLGLKEPSPDKSYTVLDAVGGGTIKRYLRRAIVRLVSLAKNCAYDPSEPAGARWGMLFDLIEAHDIETWDHDESVVRWAAAVLEKSASNLGLADYDDMLWLTWLLEAPFRPVDLLFIDECQDLSPIQHRLLPRLNVSGRTVAVGDRFQCQPAGTMIELTGGGRKPIEEIRVGDAVVSFDRHSGSMVGRDRPARKVTAVGVRAVFEDLRIIGAGGKETRCTSEHKWVARFTERSTDVFVTYLMKRGRWFRVGWCQLFNEHGNLHLGQRTRLEKADCAWILGVHNNRTDASVEESIIAAKAGLPTITFEPVEGAKHLTRESIDTVFEAVTDNSIAEDGRSWKWRRMGLGMGGGLWFRAKMVLEYFGRNIKHPFYVVNHGKNHGRTTIFETAACNLIPGLMMVPVYTGDKEPVWTVLDQVECSAPLGPEDSGHVVYSLQVEGDETYVADELVTHNSIYGFRGADVDSIPRLVTALEAEVLPLTVTFRCPRSHVAYAREIVPEFSAHESVGEGVIHRFERAEVPLLGPGDMVICPQNAPLVSAALEAIGNRLPAFVRGRSFGDSLGSIARKIGGAPTSAGFCRLVEAWRAERLEALCDREGKEDVIEKVCDQAAALQMIGETCQSPADVPGVIAGLFDETTGPDGRVCFSSVHRAKGMEARRVVYMQTAGRKSSGREPSVSQIQQSRNLEYVARTRSLDELDLVCVL
jgi:AAA domain